MISSETARGMAAKRWEKRGDVLPPPRPHDVAKIAARMSGLLKFQGSKCKYGHSGIRYSKTGHCVECIARRRDLKRIK